MSIVLDIRERYLIELMNDNPTRQLPVGDIWIEHDGKPLLVIERKTTADLESSVMDGRYREQRTRLLAYCAENKAKPMYILEGGVTGPLRRFEPQAIQKLAHRLMLRYNIPVWCSTDLEDTAKTVRILAAQIQDDKDAFVADTVSYTDVQHFTKKGNKEDWRNFTCAVLQQCPGVSAKSASALVDAFGNLESIMKQDEKTLATIKVSNKKLGPVVAKRLLGLLHGATTPVVETTVEQTE